MAEPFEEAEAREFSWDEKCDRYPRCERCGGSIYPYETYLEIEGQIYCEHCVEQCTRFVDDMEV